MSNMLDDLGSKSVPQLTEVLEVLLEEDEQLQVEQIRLTESIARVNEKRATNVAQRNLVTDELATRNPVV